MLLNSLGFCFATSKWITFNFVLLDCYWSFFDYLCINFSLIYFALLLFDYLLRLFYSYLFIYLCISYVRFNQYFLKICPYFLQVRIHNHNLSTLSILPNYKHDDITASFTIILRLIFKNFSTRN